ncbi:hypothetical protein [Lactobacillus hominis]|uniref:hypothetical protein n=1 Tax=Lactobacillus hominis TaxID=1203033 RepID=UPI0023F49BA2|nr:hypothetical protein [Lactobacillus hominis]
MQKIFRRFFTTLGIIFVVLAILILVDALHILTGPWANHLGLTFLFLVGLIFCIRWRLVFSSVLFLSFILMLHKAGIGMATVSNWTILGIAILAGLGLALIYHPHINYVKKLIKGGEPTPFATFEDQDDDVITIHSRFSDTTRNISGEFTRINLDTHFSDVDLHLDDAILATPTATIQFDCKSSSLQLYIPLEWNIEDQLQKVGSTIDYNGSENGTETKTVYFTGKIAASSLEITRV